MKRRYVSYLRVSTQAQGFYGLGVEAQRSAVAGYVISSSGDLLKEFVEVESGRRSDRPVLTEALAWAGARKATLVIARLDRLARNVAFLAALLEAGVDFVACDLPQANRLTLHILAAVAEEESRMISARTKAALAAARARGVRLGGLRPGAPPPPSGVGVEAVRRQAEARARELRPLLIEHSALSHERLARLLQEEGIATARGGRWTATQISRVRARLGLRLRTKRPRR